MPTTQLHNRRLDEDLIRLAARCGWVDPQQAEDSLRRHRDDGAAALSDLIANGALDRARLEGLRRELVAKREPTRLGRWRIHEAIGYGGMGVVYRAVGDDGEQVAIKVLSADLAADPVIQRRFRREAEAAGAIRHPRVVACHGLEVDDGRLFIVMELVRGGNAEELVERSGGGVPMALAAGICADGAAGLEAVHAAGLVHRDVKPANLLLDGENRAKLGDFSIVRARAGAAEVLTGIGRAIGTLGYMAPEQLDADADLDARADLYALGATLFFLVTGRPPFVGDDHRSVVTQVLSKPLPDPRSIRSDCSEPLAMVIRGAGALRREERYQDAHQLRVDLERARDGLLPLHAPAPSADTTRIIRRRRGPKPPIAPAVAQAVKTAAAAMQPASDVEAAANRALAAISELVTRPTDRTPADALAAIPRLIPPLAAWASTPFAAAFVTAIDALARQLVAWGEHPNPSSLRTFTAALPALRSLVSRPHLCPDLASLVALAVDDEPVSRTAMSQALRKAGVRVEAYANAADAFAALGRAPRVDLILCDVLMGDVNGFQFAAKVRAEPRHQRLPIVFVTSLSDFDKIFGAGIGGIDDVIAKPFLLKELTVKALTHLVPPATAG